MAKQQSPNPNQSNDDRSKTLNSEHPQHQAALDEHSRRGNIQGPGNEKTGAIRPSNVPGEGR
ncbi:hypothetical protein [Melittangium boletus]|uniref:Uncharacterized protein n=1 Tax=Melittangium boletus DSM 14713 TaxID=1294270 RepID=A0A250ICI2_9BACT|nr:hypothetical protein [Melittangium boletus]ATB29559.1 hypothetical protein MEBOL_003014 [Melittangium boletus DSM 14713]